jgi:hypothetical protein
MVDAELGKHMSSTVKDDVKKASKVLVDKLSALMKTQDRISKVNAEITTLKNGDLPKAVRKVAIPFQSELLEKDATSNTDFIAEQGMTIREMKEKLHMEYHIKQRVLDLQVLGLHQNALKAVVSREHFIQACSVNFPTPDKPSSSSFSILGIDDPDDPSTGGNLSFAGLSWEAFKAKICSIYKKAVDRAADLRIKQQRQVEQVSKRETEFLKKVITKSPEQHFVDTALRVVQESKGKAKGKGKGVYSGAVVDHAALAIATSQPDWSMQSEQEQMVGVRQFVHFPAEAPTTWHTSKGKGKKNGTAKEKEKGKGKGGGKNQNKGHSKGPYNNKGKGKGQNGKQGQGKGKGKAKNKGSNNNNYQQSWWPKNGTELTAHPRGRGRGRSARGGRGGRRGGRG